MLEKFEKDNDIHREKVLEKIKNGKWNLEKFELEEFNQYPGGMVLIDSKGRRIIIYDDFIMEEIKVIYEELKREEDELTDEILDTLWNNYSNLSKISGEIARLRRYDDGNIVFYRYKIKEDDDVVKVHVSEQFEENNQLYDIYEYLRKEIKDMRNRMKNEQGKTCLYYEM